MYVDFSNDKIQEIYKKFESRNFSWKYDHLNNSYKINDSFYISKKYNTQYDGIMYMDEYITILEIDNNTVKTSDELYDCFIQNRNESESNLSLNKILDSFQ